MLVSVSHSLRRRRLDDLQLGVATLSGRRYVILPFKSPSDKNDGGGGEREEVTHSHIITIYVSNRRGATSNVNSVGMSGLGEKKSL